MNILFIKYVIVGFMVSEIPRVSVFGHCPYSVTFPYSFLRSQFEFPYFHPITDIIEGILQKELLSLVLNENDNLVLSANRELLIELFIILRVYACFVLF